MKEYIILIALSLFISYYSKGQNLEKVYSIKDLNKKEEFTFQGEVISSRLLQNKLYEVCFQSQVSKKLKIFISMLPLNKKDNPKHQLIEAHYKIVKNLKTNQNQLLLTGTTIIADNPFTPQSLSRSHKSYLHSDY